jgi:hypothetical protein
MTLSKKTQKKKGKPKKPKQNAGVLKRIVYRFEFNKSKTIRRKQNNVEGCVLGNSEKALKNGWLEGKTSVFLLCRCHLLAILGSCCGTLCTTTAVRRVQR